MQGLVIPVHARYYTPFPENWENFISEFIMFLITNSVRPKLYILLKDTQNVYNVLNTAHDKI